MNFLEKDLEDIIYETHNEILRKRGLPIYGIKSRQVRIGNYGIADLITATTDGHNHVMNINVFELKKDCIDLDTFSQAVKYGRGIKNYLDYRYRDFRSININYYLIGKTVSLSSSLCYLGDMFHEINLFTYSYEIDGLYFKEVCGYKLRDEGF